jgi:hypothetical protein
MVVKEGNIIDIVVDDEGTLIPHVEVIGIEKEEDVKILRVRAADETEWEDEAGD